LKNFKLTDIRIRDPFILPDKITQTYYLCLSLHASEIHPRHSVGVITSKDLENWQGPFTIFQIPEDFWAQEGIWAPELHEYRGKYYLFLTFNTNDKFPDQLPNWPALVKRGFQVLVSESLKGPFLPFRNSPYTPADMMALDGTLWVEDGVPYLVYCHEWIQLKDGTMELVRLKDDLSDLAGDPIILFRGSHATWKGAGLKPYTGAYITDGPFLYKTITGNLLMIWSSFSPSGYTTGVAISESGKVQGPWRQLPEPLFKDDGGHGMIFKRFDGSLMLVLHQPNRGPDERARLFDLEDTGASIRIKKPHNQYQR
jgi:GH43 family beta-xylosidase